MYFYINKLIKYIFDVLFPNVHFFWGKSPGESKGEMSGGQISGAISKGSDLFFYYYTLALS